MLAQVERDTFPLSILFLCSVLKNIPETGFFIANGHSCSEHKAAASCLNAIEAVVVKSFNGT
jgi:hypothetical protein